jgi:hypothetical protein
VELAVDVAADGDWGGDGLHARLLHQNLLDHVAQPPQLLLGQELAALDLGDERLQVHDGDGAGRRH